MDEKEILKEKFKSAISSATKAISGNYEIEITFGNKQIVRFKRFEYGNVS